MSLALDAKGTWSELRRDQRAVAERERHSWRLTGRSCGSFDALLTQSEARARPKVNASRGRRNVVASLRQNGTTSPTSGTLHRLLGTSRRPQRTRRRQTRWNRANANRTSKSADRSLSRARRLPHNNRFDEPRGELASAGSRRSSTAAALTRQQAAVERRSPPGCECSVVHAPCWRASARSAVRGPHTRTVRLLQLLDIAHRVLDFALEYLPDYLAAGVTISANGLPACGSGPTPWPINLTRSSTRRVEGQR